MPECRICGNAANNTWHSVREMMLGTRDVFDYFQCSNCGCLQISSYPPDIGKYYPSDYYSFSPVQPAAKSVKKYLQNERDRYVVSGRSVVGRLVFKVKPASMFRLFSGLDLPLDAKVLDIGCGAGHFLYSMARVGFTNLTGVDPFLPAIRSPDDNIRLMKTDIAGVQGRYDLIMFHHSMEHMPRQHEQMRNIARLLAPGGTCIIRVPVCSSEAWEKYGTDWASLDAPRHYYLHTGKSMDMLARAAGLEVFRLNFDSGAFQFWASELYKRDISQKEAGSLIASPFSKQDFAQFERQAEALNAQGRGDCAAFYVHHT